MPRNEIRRRWKNGYTFIHRELSLSESFCVLIRLSDRNFEEKCSLPLSMMNEIYGKAAFFILCCRVVLYLGLFVAINCSLIWIELWRNSEFQEDIKSDIAHFNCYVDCLETGGCSIKFHGVKNWWFSRKRAILIVQSRSFQIEK